MKFSAFLSPRLPLAAACLFATVSLAPGQTAGTPEKPAAESAVGNTAPVNAPVTPAPPPAAPHEKRAAAAPAPARIKYTMPAGALGGVSIKQSGGTRGAGDGKTLPALAVLAPDHVALTTKEQPFLFWYQSQPAKLGFEITVTEPKKAKPLLTKNLETAEQAGIRTLSLAKAGVTLAEGSVYRWSVALIPDPANRSRDLLSSAMIKRIPVPAGLAEKLATASEAEKAALYAEAGIWYDALQSISTALAKEPASAKLHLLRAQLLQQAGLSQAAQMELH